MKDDHSMRLIRTVPAPLVALLGLLPGRFWSFTDRDLRTPRHASWRPRACCWTALPPWSMTAWCSIASWTTR